MKRRRIVTRYWPWGPPWSFGSSFLWCTGDPFDRPWIMGGMIWAQFKSTGVLYLGRN